MFKDVVTTCPLCTQETTLAISAPEAGSIAREKVSVTSCRKCKGRIIAVTFPDGTVQITPFQVEEANIESPRPVILSSVFGLAEISRIPYALWQPRGFEIDEFRIRPAWAKALREALLEAQRKPRPLSVPRRIFLSYRWGKPEEDDWVEFLCKELERRGNYVEFDRKAQREARPPLVTELVARLAACHVFMAVLDPGYLGRISSDTKPSVEGWVTDEFHTALSFANAQILKFYGFLRAGDQLPGAFRLFALGEAGNTFDIRDPDDLQPILDRFFVQFGTAPEEEIAARAAAALHQSRKALDAGEAERAFESADEACGLVPEIADGFAQRCRVAYRLKRPAESLRDARRALEIDPTMDEMLIYAASSSLDIGEWKEAAAIARVALERNRAEANAHYIVGKALNELDQVDASLAHLQIATTTQLRLPALYNEIGSVWRRLGQPGKALECYQEGRKLDPFSEIFLVNSTAAAMEAGLPTAAVKLLQLLAKHHPDSEYLSQLTPILYRWCSEDLPPPILSKVIAPPPAVGLVTCNECPAAIPLTLKNQLLCAGCGAVLPPSIEPCKCCGGQGTVLPDLSLKIGASLQCPYCSTGNLSYVLTDPERNVGTQSGDASDAKSAHGLAD